MKNKNTIEHYFSFRNLLCWILIFSFGLTPIRETRAASQTGQNESRTSSNSDEDEGDSSESGDSNDSNTIIARGFLVHLSCTQDSKLNGDFRVAINGKIHLPYNVVITAAGLKRSTLEEQLQKSYTPYFRGTPQIKVTIKQRRYWVKISGVVKNPGSFLLKEHSTLDEALSMADGRSETLTTGFARIGQGATWRWVSLEDYLKGGPAHDLPAWKGGEQIIFQLERPEGMAEITERGEKPGAEALGPSARKVQVLGEVRNPGGVSFQRNADGYYYLIQRGGPTQNADLEVVSLIRRDQKTGEASRIQLGNIEDVKNLQESDVLIINPARPTKVERGLQTTALIASIISSIVLTVYVTKK